LEDSFERFFVDEKSFGKKVFGWRGRQPGTELVGGVANQVQKCLPLH
jgi:hypothetical protein